MDSFLANALLIFVLILVAGVFSMSEIAVISARRSRIRQLAEEGSERARFLAKLHADPDRFFATVQVGVTVIQSVASALGGALAIEFLKPALAPLLAGLPAPGLDGYAEPIALFVVVLTISYLTLTLGELVPKSIGFKFSESLSLWLARPLDLLARLAGPFVRFLTASTKGVMRLFGGGSKVSPFVSEEEIKFLVQEGRERGIFEPSEQELIHSVFDFTEKVVREIMVPRPKIHGIAADTSPEEVVRRVVESGYSRYPVYTSSLDDTHGILYNKDLLDRLGRREPIVLREMLHPVHFVPENKKVSHLLKEMQRRRLAMIMVVNEYGNVEGLVTVEDLIEEIVGEIQDEYDMEERPVERLPDGSLLVDGTQNLRDLKQDYPFPFSESPEYETLAGFLLSRLQRIPKGGEVIIVGNYRLTVVDVEGRRIHRVKIEPRTGGVIEAPAAWPAPSRTDRPKS
jgi:putative hemolysin